MTGKIHYIAPPCPVCGGTMHDNAIRNCRSRHANIFICVECGKREAFEGFFWRDKYETNFLSIHAIQRGWMNQ